MRRRTSNPQEFLCKSLSQGGEKECHWQPGRKLAQVAFLVCFYDAEETRVGTGRDQRRRKRTWTPRTPGKALSDIRLWVSRNLRGLVSVGAGFTPGAADNRPVWWVAHRNPRRREPGSGEILGLGGQVKCEVERSHRGTMS